MPTTTEEKEQKPEESKEEIKARKLAERKAKMAEVMAKKEA
jgi:hypothetical protein